MEDLSVQINSTGETRIILLSWNTRTILAQLRSEFSFILNSYRVKIILGIVNRCLKCNNSSYGKSHSINCMSSTIDVRLIGLWAKAIDIAHFLELQISHQDSNYTPYYNQNDNTNLWNLILRKNQNCYNNNNNIT